MSQLSVKIITPAGEIFQGEVASLVAPGSDGLFGILPQHAPLIASLGQGLLTLKGAKESAFNVDQGVLEFTDKNECFILTNQAEAVHNS